MPDDPDGFDCIERLDTNIEEVDVGLDIVDPVTDVAACLKGVILICASMSRLTVKLN